MQSNVVRALFAGLTLMACHRETLYKKQHVDSFAAPLRVVEHAELTSLLGDHPGVIAVLRDGTHEVHCSALTCRERAVPASTFKVPHALIGLETGVIRDADFVIPWDGVTREIPEWNHDHSLRSAIKVSAVWYFQELARRVGPAREAEWLKKLDYGNRETGEHVDRFWLDGPLAISPVEQLAFLQRLAHSQLPVQARSLDIVRDIIVLAEHDGAVLRGKTGWFHPHQADEAGWFIGYSERANERAYAAVLLRHTPNTNDADFLAARRAIAERALTQQGAW